MKKFDINLLSKKGLFKRNAYIKGISLIDPIVKVNINGVEYVADSVTVNQPDEQTYTANIKTSNGNTIINGKLIIDTGKDTPLINIVLSLH